MTSPFLSRLCTSLAGSARRALVWAVITAFIFVGGTPIPSAHATAPTAGLDSTQSSLPIAVQGQTAIMLNADTSGATPAAPSVAFSGPINMGKTAAGTYATTLRNDGSAVIGSLGTNPVLAVNGDVQVGSSTMTCSATTAGAIRWTGTDFVGCNGANWQPLMGRTFAVPMSTLAAYTPTAAVCTEPAYFDSPPGNMFYCISACKRFCMGDTTEGVADNGLRYGGGTITENDINTHMAACSCF